MKKFIFVIAGILFLGVLYFATLFLISYSELTKVASSHIGVYDDRPENYGLVYEKISFKSTDSLNLQGWYMQADNPKAVVILLHGFGIEKGGKVAVGAKNGMLPWADFLVKNGYSTLLFDFRNQGESEGSKITFGKDEMKDIEGAVQFLGKRPETGGLPLVLYGISFGGSMSLLYGGTHKDVDAVITTGAYADFTDQLVEEVKNSPFARLPFVETITKIASHFAYGPSKDLSPKNVVKNISPTPLFIVHGQKDDRISPSQAESLFSNAKEPKKIWKISEGDHGVIGRESNIPESVKAEYKAEVLKFLDQLF